MLVIACFCGAVYKVLWGTTRCPVCGRDDVPEELDVQDSEESEA